MQGTALVNVLDLRPGTEEFLAWECHPVSHKNLPWVCDSYNPPYSSFTLWDQNLAVCFPLKFSLSYFTCISHLFQLLSFEPHIWLSYLSFLLMMKWSPRDAFQWFSLEKPGLDFKSRPELYPMTMIREQTWFIRITWRAWSCCRCPGPTLRHVWRAREYMFLEDSPLEISIRTLVKMHCIILCSFIYSFWKHPLQSYQAAVYSGRHFTDQCGSDDKGRFLPTKKFPVSWKKTHINK